MDNLETPVLSTVSEPPKGDDVAPKATSSRYVGFPEFEDVDNLQEVVNSVPWDDVEKEASLLSCRSTPSRINCQQNLFGNNSFVRVVANASFGSIYMDAYIYTCSYIILVFYLLSQIYLFLFHFLYFAASTLRASLHHFDFYVLLDYLQIQSLQSIA